MKNSLGLLATLQLPELCQRFKHLGNSGCQLCHGAGLRLGGAATVGWRLCHCVERAIFRICLNEWRRLGELVGVKIQCSDFEKFVASKCRTFTGANNYKTFGNPQAEFCADFQLLATRTLTRVEFAVFDHHHLQDKTWNSFKGLSRGNYFHTIYRVEQKLGVTFSTTKPFALFPIDLYYQRISWRKEPRLAGLHTIGVTGQRSGSCRLTPLTRLATSTTGRTAESQETVQQGIPEKGEIGDSDAEIGTQIESDRQRPGHQTGFTRWPWGRKVQVNYGV